MRDDPPASAPFSLPLGEEYGQLEHLYSTNSPDIREALGAVRAAAGDGLLVGEVYLPAAEVTPYLEHLDLAFAFELFHSPWERDALARAVGAAASALANASAWVLSNHDFPRLASRFGRENTRAAALLLLTLPGTAFVYQGEEIGMADGPGANPPVDRAGRDGARHPMQWTPEGGFTDGHPWLPIVDPRDLNVEQQRDDPGSLLTLYRELLDVRRALRGAIEPIAAAGGVLAYRRGDHLIAINITAEEREAPPHGDVVLATHDTSARTLPPHAGIVAKA
jgi:alpha-glucosidase